jgi:hypothetical protein
MRRAVVRVVVAAVLIGIGWTAGKAQSTQPDFELVIFSPSGKTTVECRRGCELAWIERGQEPRAKAQSSFTFGCSGVERCSSSRIGGWVKP